MSTHGSASRQFRSSALPVRSAAMQLPAVADYM